MYYESWKCSHANPASPVRQKTLTDCTFLKKPWMNTALSGQSSWVRNGDGKDTVDVRVKQAAQGKGAYWLGVSTEWGSILPMWGPMVDRLLAQLNREGEYTYCNNDNMASLITEKFSDTVSELLQSPLNITQSWCMTEDLSVNWTRKNLCNSRRGRRQTGSQSLFY